MASFVNGDRAARWYALPGVLFLLAMTALPLLMLVRVSLYEQGSGFYQSGTWTLRHYRSLLQADFLQIALVTLSYAVAISISVTLTALPCGLWLASRTKRWGPILLSMVVLPKFASMLVILFGWQQLLSSAGPFSRLAVWLQLIPEAVPLNRSPVAALVAEVSLILPYTIVILFAQHRRIDPRLSVVAAGLGASPSQVFRRITLPLMMPGLRAVALLSFVWGMGAFLGPLMLAGPESTTLSVQIQKTAMESGRWPLAAAQSVVLLTTIAVVGGTLAVLTRRRSA